MTCSTRRWINPRSISSTRAGRPTSAEIPPTAGALGSQSKQKADLKQVFTGRINQWRSLDYVAGWFMKAGEYMGTTRAASAFVTTNSLNQGQQAAILWPAIFATESRKSRLLTPASNGRIWPAITQV